LIEEMTEELRLSEKAAYEKLIRMMSHEVNNSVGAVRSLLDSALRWAPQIGAADRDDYVTALSGCGGGIRTTSAKALMKRFSASMRDEASVGLGGEEA